MAPRSIWKGAISFGMVIVPVKVFNATSSKSLSFTTLHESCGSRPRMKRWCPVDDVEVTPKETIRAYEYSKDQYVPMENADFERVQVPSTHTIEIKQFVEASEIDPIYFEKSYALEPEAVAVKPYYLLKEAIENAGLVAIAKVSIRQKEHMAAIRPYENGLLMSTMLYPDEITGNSELQLPGEVDIVSEELAMANTLIEQMKRPFEPEEYVDEYREALIDVIEAKLAGTEPITPPTAPPQGQVGDLMSALKASIAAAKPAGDGKPAEAAKPKARAKKPAAAGKPKKSKARA